MRALHLGVTVGLVAAVTIATGCGGSDADRSTDTAATSTAAGPQNPATAASVGSSTSTASTPVAAPTPEPATSSTLAPTTGRVVDVQMLGDASGYRFAPVTVTVKRGDRIRWTMVSGPPHNVAFWPDSIPAGAAGPLGANMPKTIGPLSGPLMMAPNETYEISFAGVPAGTYRYYCTPHLAMGMVGVVRVE
jgi:plastocyanin